MSSMQKSMWSDENVVNSILPPRRAPPQPGPRAIPIEQPRAQAPQPSGPALFRPNGTAEALAFAASVKKLPSRPAPRSMFDSRNFTPTPVNTSQRANSSTNTRTFSRQNLEGQRTSTPATMAQPTTSSRQTLEGPSPSTRAVTSQARVNNENLAPHQRAAANKRVQDLPKPEQTTFDFGTTSKPEPAPVRELDFSSESRPIGIEATTPIPSPLPKPETASRGTVDKPATATVSPRIKQEPDVSPTIDRLREVKNLEPASPTVKSTSSAASVKPQPTGQELVPPSPSRVDSAHGGRLELPTTEEVLMRELFDLVKEQTNLEVVRSKAEASLVIVKGQIDTKLKRVAELKKQQELEAQLAMK